MSTITNPILPGFNPDPSICRCGEDYYIATSTFEWFPGVQIHHSRDLVHWRLLTRPLVRRSQLDLRGDPNSAGVWAPCLTWADGLFWLIYTDVKSFRGPFKDTHNYLVTAPDIMGPWSEPIYLNSSGFDPSLFHDADGRKWLVNMVWDPRAGRNRFGGILLQEYSHDQRRLVGPIRHIFAGTALGVTEGPHLYRRGGWYYLMTAEGGTGVNHAVTMARSKEIGGPYEVDPCNPMLTSAGKPDAPLWKAGHASIVETPQGQWYMVHLCGRPLASRQVCPLGRETAIQKVAWDADGWLRLEGGGNTPRLHVPGPPVPAHPFAPLAAREDFDDPTMPLAFQSLRIPFDESWVSLRARPGWLRIHGRESLASWHDQSMVARRVQAFVFEARTAMAFRPTDFLEAAGLICFYSTSNYHYLHVTHDQASGGACLGILSCDNGKVGDPPVPPVPLGDAALVYLRAQVARESLILGYSLDGIAWTDLPVTLDFSILSDEHPRKNNEFGFTGAFVGLCCQDMSGRGNHADFDWFEYVEL